MSFDALKSAQETLSAEREGLLQLEQSLGQEFVDAVKILGNAKGKTSRN